MHITIFGAAGWVGRATLRALSGPHDIRAVDLNEAAWERYADTDGTWDAGEIVHADMRDHEAIDRALEGTDAVLHLSAAFPSGVEQAGLAFGVNVHGLWNVLEAARHRGLRRVVHMGSCPVEHPSTFYQADIRRHDGELYAVTKRMQEEMCRQFHEAWGSSIIVLRPVMIVDSRLGLLRHGAPTGVAPYRTRSGWVCRHDLAEACRLALESTTIDFDVLHIVGTPESDATCNAARAREVLGFEPKADLEQYR